MPSATDIANYVRCARRSYLDVHGDEAKKLPPSAFLQMLWEGGRTHEDDVIGRWAAVAVPAGSLVERAAATVQLMEKGVPAIYHGLLQSNDLVGEPDLLVRVDGYVSRYGVYAYIPVDVKNGNAFIDTANSKPKPAYAVQLSVYAELLMTVQGMLPPVGGIIDKDGVEQTYDLAAFYPEYERIRDEFLAARLGVHETRPGWKNACTSCVWQKHCWDELKAADDLTTVDGLGESYRARLWTIGIKTATDLAAADPATLSTVKGIKGARAMLWTRKAQVQKAGAPLRLASWSPPDAAIEVSYDIEDFTFDPFVYLHGFLVRGARGPAYGTPGFTDQDFGEFQPICASAGDTEAEVWVRFLEKLEELERLGPIVTYVYSHHEKSVLKRLAQEYGGSEALDRFLASFIDLERVVKRSVVLPTDSSTLKALAQWMGFRWRDEDPGGAQSLAWWNDYWTNPKENAHLRERVLRYNEDDVRASFVLKDWLAAFCAPAESHSSSPSPSTEREDAT